MYTIIAYIRFLFKSSNQHGVHSPFVYDLLTKCFYNKKKYSEYRLITTSSNRLIVSCLHYFACKEIAFSEQQSIDLFGKAFSGINCFSLEQINEATTMVVLDKVVSKAAVQKLIAPLSNDSLLIIKKPHQNKKQFQLWQEVLSLEKVSLSIDTFNLGFIFFRIEQANQNFIIRA